MNKKLLFLNREDRKSRFSWMRSNLYMHRSASSLSQSELASLSGVSVRLIQHYEQGEKDINKAQAGTLMKIANVLNCTIEDLLETE